MSLGWDRDTDGTPLLDSGDRRRLAAVVAGVLGGLAGGLGLFLALGLAGAAGLTVLGGPLMLDSWPGAWPGILVAGAAVITVPPLGVAYGWTVMARLDERQTLRMETAAWGPYLLGAALPGLAATALATIAAILWAVPAEPLPTALAGLGFSLGSGGLGGGLFRLIARGPRPMP